MEAALEAEEQCHRAAKQQPSLRAQADASRGASRGTTAGVQEKHAGYPDCAIAQRLQEVVSKPVPQVRSKLATSVDPKGRGQRCTESVDKNVPLPFWHDLLFLIILLEVSIAVLPFFARRDLFAVYILPPDVLSLFFEVPLVNALRILRITGHEQGQERRQGRNCDVSRRTFDRAIFSTPRAPLVLGLGWRCYQKPEEKWSLET